MRIHISTGPIWPAPYTTRERKRTRREARCHAQNIRHGLPERAALWARRARNG